MDSVNDRGGMACAAVDNADAIEMTYVALVKAGFSSSEVSVLATDEFDMNGRAALGILSRLVPVQGGFTGGIRTRAVGPARSFGVSGSIASGLIRAGIDDAEAAWLMNALVDGRALVLVHVDGNRELKGAHSIFSAHGVEVFEAHRAPSNRRRHRPPIRASGVARPELDRSLRHPE